MIFNLSLGADRVRTVNIFLPVLFWALVYALNYFFFYTEETVEKAKKEKPQKLYLITYSTFIGVFSIMFFVLITLSRNL